MRVLIVEDERDMAEVLKVGLGGTEPPRQPRFRRRHRVAGGAGLRLRRDCSGRNASKA
jgi:hypothetical protein